MKQLLKILSLTALFAVCGVNLRLAQACSMHEDGGSSMHDSAHNEMHRAMNEPTGNADIDFARGMIPHHEMALDMAKRELESGHDPELRSLATAIIKAQNKEIDQMQSWLDKNDK